jgi:hypothetical protein
MFKGWLICIVWKMFWNIIYLQCRWWHYCDITPKIWLFECLCLEDMHYSFSEGVLGLHLKKKKCIYFTFRGMNGSEGFLLDLFKSWLENLALILFGGIFKSFMEQFQAVFRDEGASIPRIASHFQSQHFWFHIAWQVNGSIFAESCQFVRNKTFFNCVSWKIFFIQSWALWY